MLVTPITPSVQIKKRHHGPQVMTAAESIGVKSQCNYIRKFTPLSRYFGMRALRGVNPLINSRGGGSRDSLLSFKDDEFMQALDSEFLSKAKLQNEKLR